MSNYINYSKFDKIEVSTDEEDNGNYRKPQVTTLKKTDKVVLSPEGLTILKEETTDGTKIEEEEMQRKIKKEKLFKQMIRNGAVVPFQYLWNQSLQDISFYLVIPANTKARDLDVQIDELSFVVKRKKHNKEENNTINRDTSKSNDIEVMIQKNFPFKVCTNEESQLWEIKKEKIYWKEIFFFANEINNQDKKYSFVDNSLVEKEEIMLYVSLKKKIEIENSHVWWNCLFKDEDSINVATLPDRIAMNKNTRNQKYDFKSVWEEAHEIFKKNITKKNLPFPIDP